MGKETLQAIQKLLQGVPYTLETHPEIPRSSFEAAKIRGSDVTKGAKALILKADETIIQAVVPAHKKTKFSVLKKHLGAKRVQLASPDEVLSVTGCVVGSVPPVGVLWDLPVFFDEEILEKDEIVFSAGTHTESIHIAPQVLQEINNAVILELT